MNFSIQKGFFGLCLIAMSAVSLAMTKGGDSVGNGGVIWACYSDQLESGLLTDLFEARIQAQLPIIESQEADPMKIYEQRKLWLKTELPEFYETLQAKFEFVEKHLAFVQAELLPTGDYTHVIQPDAALCPSGPWRSTNIANFREEDEQVLVNASLWASPKISSLDKAALLFHEAVYSWMRTYFAATNSDQARKINGLLFSSLSKENIREEIRKILGAAPEMPNEKYICIMRNSKTNRLFVAYDQDLQKTSLKVRLRCQDQADPGWCSKSSLACEEIHGPVSHQCISENSSSRKVYTGKGRNLVEAEFNAHMSCYIGSQSQGPLVHFCPDLPFLECN